MTAVGPPPSAITSLPLRIASCSMLERARCLYRLIPKAEAPLLAGKPLPMSTTAKSYVRWGICRERDATGAISGDTGRLAGFPKQLEERLDDVDRHRKD